MDAKKLDSSYIVPTYNRFDLLISSGKGSTLYDENGREYIDFGTGIAVNTFGVCDDEWTFAVKSQIEKVQHTSNLYYNEPCSVLAKLLCEKTGLSKVFFSNSGAEANECAIKTARKYGTDKNPEKNVIITLKNSFHGRTVTTLSATGQDVFHKNFTPFTEGFLYVSPNEKDELLNAVSDKVCAVMIEIVQGEGGINVLNRDYLDLIKEITEKNDILLIVDEVQTGNGRTGKMYSYMNFDLNPDIVTTAKGLAGGLPMGATLFGRRSCDVLTSGDHGSTFGGNPVCASGAISIVSRLDEKLFSDVRKKGEYIKERLVKTDGVLDVSGLGLMIGVKTKADAKEVAKKCLSNGLLVLTAKDKIRFLPALNISFCEIDKGLDIFEKVLKGEI